MPRATLWRRPTIVLGVIWGLLLCVLLWQFPAISRPVLIASLVFPVYYFGLSFVLHFSRR